MSETPKPRLVGINHVAIEVGDIDAALEWYGRLFAFTLRGKGERNAFIDMGDQFINMTLMPRPEGQDVERRHIGLVVDDRSRIIELAKAAGARMVEGQFLDFLDPWGNRLEIIEYATSSSPRPRMSCAAWDSPSTRTRRRGANWPTRAWRRNRGDKAQFYWRPPAGFNPRPQD